MLNDKKAYLYYTFVLIYIWNIDVAHKRILLVPINIYNNWMLQISNFFMMFRFCNKYKWMSDFQQWHCKNEDMKVNYISIYNSMLQQEHDLAFSLRFKCESNLRNWTNCQYLRASNSSCYRSWFLYYCFNKVATLHISTLK